MAFWHRSAAVLLTALCTTACGISTPSSNTVDPVSGTLGVGANVLHAFSVSRSGEVEITITSLVPTPPINSVWISLGLLGNGTCDLLPAYSTPIIVNRVVPFGSLNKADYCLIVYESTVLATPVAYTGRISHP